MRLVSDWRNCLRWNSMRILGAIAAIPVIWAAIPPEAQLWIPAEWRPYILTALALGGMAARIIKQGDDDA